MTSPKLLGPETPDAVLAALRTVAERSFFSETERCDDGAFSELAAPVSRWIVATVRFEEGPWIGFMSCTLSADLAAQLFDRFTGRDPADPVPSTDDVHDLVGEFANMVCGAWLSRSAGDWAFTLGPPVVTTAGGPAHADDLRLLVAVSQQPLAVDLVLRSTPGDDALAGASGRGYRRA